LAHAVGQAVTMTPEQKELVQQRLTRKQDVSDEEIWDFVADE
jgi:hypothetical protein